MLVWGQPPLGCPAEQSSVGVRYALTLPSAARLSDRSRKILQYPDDSVYRVGGNSFENGLRVNSLKIWLAEPNGRALLGLDGRDARPYTVLLSWLLRFKLTAKS